MAENVMIYLTLESIQLIIKLIKRIKPSKRRRIVIKSIANDDLTKWLIVQLDNRIIFLTNKSIDKC